MRVPVNSLGKMYRTCKQTCTNANSAASGRRISPTTVSGYIDEMIRNFCFSKQPAVERMRRTFA